MSTIVVKNFPEDLLERLKDRAERNHRSMTKEVVHLLAAGLGAEPSPAAPKRPLPPSVTSHSGRTISIQQIEALAGHPIETSKPADGREALRAALVKQPDGTFVNVLGIEDSTFFDTLQRIRGEAKAPDVRHLFDAKP